MSTQQTPEHVTQAPVPVAPRLLVVAGSLTAFLGWMVGIHRDLYAGAKACGSAFRGSGYSPACAAARSEGQLVPVLLLGLGFVAIGVGVAWRHYLANDATRSAAR